MTRTRILTALVLAPLMIGGIFFLPLQSFALFIALIATIGAWEWANIAGYEKNIERVVYATTVFACLFASARVVNDHREYLLYFLSIGTFWWVLAFILVKRYPSSTGVWNPGPVRALLGLFVLVPMWAGFMHLKQEQHSDLLIVFVMLVIWGADSGAYFAGRQWGKSKLAPNVSPGKSWAGFWGGFVVSLLVAAGFLVYIDQYIQPVTFNDVLKLLCITMITSVASVLGDLVESMMKRHRGIKDSSSLLPGHGGLLDRIDSMASAVPVFSFCMLVFNWSLDA